MRHKAAWATCAAIAAIGCGSSGNSGDNNTTPPAPSGTIVSIAVNSSAPTMFLEASETFTAVATYTGGATQTVTGGAWATDASAVAQVDASTGRVVALSNGEATISFDYQGVRGSKHVRVLPNYGGNWFGKYAIASCTQTEGFDDLNVCGNFGVGQTFDYALVFTQAGEVVSGNTVLGVLGSSSTSSNVNPDGSLTFTMQIFVGTVEIDLVWKLTCTRANVINGAVTQTWTDAMTPGQMMIEGVLQSPTKQSVARTLEAGEPRRSLAEVVAAVRR